MKAFFLAAIAVFLLGNTYLFVRGWQALELIGRWRWLYVAVFWALALLFIGSHLIRSSHSIWQVIGSEWVAVMLYAVLLLLCIDIFRIIGWIGGIRPAFIYAHYPVAKLTLMGLVIIILCGIFTIGYRNARYPVIKTLDMTATQQQCVMPKIRIVMVSDIHLGHTAGRDFLRRVVDNLNTLDADVVLLVGDTFDGDPTPVVRDNMCAEFDRLRSRYGVYAVGGNHERIGERFARANIAFDELRAHGVKVLLDSVALVNNAFYIAGRKDLSAGRRESLAELLQPTAGTGKPVILLDHQPFHLEEAEQAGVTLELAGHTHHGQMFPLNLITARMYEQDWGYLQKGGTQYYVSCGVGTWGPKVRTGSRSEIVLIRLRFE
jgi:predicted MPP superfamily phosphohydrolase